MECSIFYNPRVHNENCFLKGTHKQTRHSAMAKEGIASKSMEWINDNFSSSTAHWKLLRRIQQK